MASPSSLLSEEQFLCSICLDVFTQPVALPCGHNFCMACIRKYWDCNDLCQCPMCKKTFDRRPELFVNNFISEMAAEFKKSIRVKDSDSDNRLTKPEVPCDICPGTKQQALKSCLVCLVSFCENHLEPHQRVAALKKHKLIHPVKNLEGRMCKKHERLLELFCRTDQTCVCQFCTETDHKTHDTVPLEEECTKRKSQLGKTDAKVQQMIQERQEKIQKIKLSVETMKRNAKKDISDSGEIYSAMVSFIERSQTELIRVIEEKQKAAEKQAEGFIKDLKKEITELQRISTDVMQLSHTEDHQHFLQSFPSLSTPLPTKDWSEVRVHGDLSVGTDLEETLKTAMEKLSAVKMKMMQQYATDVTLDPATANPWLTLSEDRKQVRCADVKNKLPDIPERFVNSLSVLGRQGFTAGRFYYEVQVQGKTFLGVARESMNRKGVIKWSPMNGVWAILKEEDQYTAQAKLEVPLSLRKSPQTVGVFVDYEEGQVSFYDVEARSHIYTFTGCSFKEKLYPLFNPYFNGSTKTSLIITPINPSAPTEMFN